MKKLILRELRAARRLLGGSARDFAREERGSVLVMFVVMAVPLATVLFTGFNTGVGLLTRMRAQNVADAASYTGALWQARFLNYCGYTRRHIVANYADIALLTAYEDSLIMLADHVHDAENLSIGIWDFSSAIDGIKDDIDDMGDYDDLSDAEKQQIDDAIGQIDGVGGGGGTCGEDTGSITDALSNFQIDSLFSDDGLGMKFIRSIRDGCDTMNGWLHQSQQVLHPVFAFDALPITLMTDVTEAASGRQETDFKLNLLESHSQLLLPKQLLRTDGEIPKKEVRAYFDPFTDNRAHGVFHLGGGIFLGLGRSPYVYAAIATDELMYQCPDTSPEYCFTAIMNISSDDIVITDTKMVTSSVPTIPSLYCYFFMWIGPIPFCGCCLPLPICAPINGVATDTQYELKNSFPDTTVMEIESENFEPSTTAVVEVEMRTAPFFRGSQANPEGGLGLYPDRLTRDRFGSPREIRAFSRAKTYFRGWGEDNGGTTYQSPNMNYPFWGAKLAPISELDLFEALAIGEVAFKSVDPTRALTHEINY